MTSVYELKPIHREPLIIRNKDAYHLLLRSLADALNLYGASPEPHLNTHQLDILQDLTEYLDLKFE